MPIERIISGGQTGVDTAALRLGIIHRIPIGGTVPRGFQREDGTIPDIYRPHLTEGDSTSPARRTARNVEDADATLILHTGALEGGTKLTADLCAKHLKASLVVNLDDNRATSDVVEWLLGLADPVVLNIAGPRESHRPGIARRAYAFLEQTILPVREIEQATESVVHNRLAELLARFFASARAALPVVEQASVDDVERSVLEMIARLPAVPELRAIALLEPRAAASAFKDRNSRLASLLASLGPVGRGEDLLTQSRLF